MPEVALGFLGTTHPRALNLNEGPELSKLRKFFKGILITFTHRKGKKKIESIVPRGGFEQFEWNKDKSEGVVQSTTVQVHSTSYLFLCIHWYGKRRISGKHTTLRSGIRMPLVSGLQAAALYPSNCALSRPTSDLRVGYPQN